MWPYSIAFSSMNFFHCSAETDTFNGKIVSYLNSTRKYYCATIQVRKIAAEPLQGPYM